VPLLTVSSRQFWLALRIAHRFDLDMLGVIFAVTLILCRGCWLCTAMLITRVAACSAYGTVNVFDRARAWAVCGEPHPNRPICSIAVNMPLGYRPRIGNSWGDSGMGAQTRIPGLTGVTKGGWT
jgi:hypothetical protein